MNNGASMLASTPAWFPSVDAALQRQLRPGSGLTCGTCPASLTGTLAAIEGLVQKEIDPELVVISV